MSSFQEPLNRREFLNLLYLKSSQWVKDCVKPFAPSKPSHNKTQSPSENLNKEEPVASFRDSF